MEIRVANESDLGLFFQYLDRQLQNNGANGAPVFQPLSREDSKLSDVVKGKFSTGLGKVIGEEGWRMLMLAFIDQQIVGHIDIRPYPDKNSQHRVLLGMGVDIAHRRKGIAGQLIKNILDWMQANTAIEYLDLGVMSENLPAIRLYEKLGFSRVGEISDRFRFDGKCVAETLMSLQLKNYAR